MVHSATCKGSVSCVLPCARCFDCELACAEPAKGPLPGRPEGAGPGGQQLPLHSPGAGSCAAADAPGPVLQPGPASGPPGCGHPGPDAAAAHPRPQQSQRAPAARRQPSSQRGAPLKHPVPFIGALFMGAVDYFQTCTFKARDLPWDTSDCGVESFARFTKSGSAHCSGANNWTPH